MTSEHFAWQPFEPTEAAPSVFLAEAKEAGAVIALAYRPSDEVTPWARDAALSLTADAANHADRLFLMDLDLERPALHRALGFENEEGASDIFLFGASLRRVARRTKGSSYYFASAGTATADPDAVLTHHRWARLIQGFEDARATLVLFVPLGSNGARELLERVDRIVLLAGADGEADSQFAELSDRVVLALHPPLPPPALVEVDEADVVEEADVVDIRDLAPDQPWLPTEESPEEPPEDEGADVERAVEPEEKTPIRYIVDIRDLAPEPPVASTAEISPATEAAEGPADFGVPAERAGPVVDIRDLAPDPEEAAVGGSGAAAVAPPIGTDEADEDLDPTDEADVDLGVADELDGNQDAAEEADEADEDPVSDGGLPEFDLDALDRFEEESSTAGPEEEHPPVDLPPESEGPVDAGVGVEADADLDEGAHDDEVDESGVGWATEADAEGSVLESDPWGGPDEAEAGEAVESREEDGAPDEEVLSWGDGALELEEPEPEPESESESEEVGLSASEPVSSGLAGSDPEPDSLELDRAEFAGPVSDESPGAPGDREGDEAFGDDLVTGPDFGGGGPDEDAIWAEEPPPTDADVDADRSPGQSRPDRSDGAAGVATAEHEDESAPDDKPPEPEEGRRPSSKASRGAESGRPLRLILLLLLVVVGAVAAHWFGLVRVPGLDGVLSTVLGPARTGTAPVVDEGGPVPVTPVLGYSLSVDSYRDARSAADVAQALSQRLPEQLFLVAPVQVDGSTSYVLHAGPAETPVEADELREPLAAVLTREDPSSWVVRYTPFAFLLDERGDIESARTRAAALSEGEVFAYVLEVAYPDESVRYRVYAGAYETPEEARAMQGLLSGEGIPGSRFTERRGLVPGSDDGSE